MLHSNGRCGLVIEIWALSQFYWLYSGTRTHLFCLTNMHIDDDDKKFKIADVIDQQQPENELLYDMVNKTFFHRKYKIEYLRVIYTFAFRFFFKRSYFSLKSGKTRERKNA